MTVPPPRTVLPFGTYITASMVMPPDGSFAARRTPNGSVGLTLYGKEQSGNLTLTLPWSLAQRIGEALIRPEEVFVLGSVQENVSIGHPVGECPEHGTTTAHYEPETERWVCHADGGMGGTSHETADWAVLA